MLKCLNFTLFLFVIISGLVFDFNYLHAEEMSKHYDDLKNILYLNRDSICDNSKNGQNLPIELQNEIRHYFSKACKDPKFPLLKQFSIWESPLVFNLEKPEEGWKLFRDTFCNDLEDSNIFIKTIICSDGRDTTGKCLSNSDSEIFGKIASQAAQISLATQKGEVLSGSEAKQIDQCVVNLITESYTKLDNPQAVKAALLEYFSRKRERAEKVQWDVILSFINASQLSKGVDDYLNKNYKCNINRELSPKEQIILWIKTFRNHEKINLEKMKDTQSIIERSDSNYLLIPEFHPEAEGYKLIPRKGIPGQGGSTVEQYEDKNGRRVWLKYNPQESGEQLREYAAFKLNQLLGLNLIPPTRLVRVKAKDRKGKERKYLATLTDDANQYAKQKLTQVNAMQRGELLNIIGKSGKSEEYENLKAFDYLCAQMDRTAQNVLVSNGEGKSPPKIIAIDNGGSGASTSFSSGFKSTAMNGLKISGANFPDFYPAELRDRLMQLQYRDVRNAFSTGLFRLQVEGVWLRILAMKEDMKSKLSQQTSTSVKVPESSSKESQTIHGSPISTILPPLSPAASSRPNVQK